jgi:hypothetical protein
MKKVVLGLSLVLAALPSLVSPAMAAPALSAADKAFIASLAARSGAPAPVPAAKRPALGEKALCTATADCGNGTTVYCESNASTTSCSSADRNCAAGEQGHVTCDGATIWCQPACPVICDCNALENDCLWSCDPCPYSFTCDPTTCDSTCRCRFRLCLQ